MEFRGPMVSRVISRGEIWNPDNRAIFASVLMPWWFLQIGYLPWQNFSGIALSFLPLRSRRQGERAYRFSFEWRVVSYEVLADFGWMWPLYVLSPVWPVWRENTSSSRAWTGRHHEIVALVWKWNHRRYWQSVRI